MPWTLRATFDHLCFALTDVSELLVQIRKSDQDRQVELEGKAEGLGWRTCRSRLCANN